MLKRDRQAVHLRMTLCAGLEEELSGEQAIFTLVLGSLTNDTEEMPNDLLLQLEKRLAPLPHRITSRMHLGCLKPAQVCSEAGGTWIGIEID